MLASIAISLSLFVVTESPRPASIEVFTTSSSSVALQADRRDALRSFAADRVRDAFGVESGGLAYAVGLHFESAERVLIEVSRDGELLASRAIELRADFAESCADVWMLVRSSIERDQTELAASSEVPETPPIEDAKTSTAAIVEAAPVAEPATATAVATVAENDPQPMVAARSTPIASAPWGEDIESISATLMTEASVHSGLGFGPAVSASVELERGVIIGAGLAYRASSPAELLNITRVPLSLRAGYVPVREFDVEAGVSLTLDLGVASTAERDGAIVGINAGPYVRGRLPFTSWDGAEISFVGEMGVALSLLRSSFFIDGAEYSDSILSARATAGLEWRWR